MVMLKKTLNLTISDDSEAKEISDKVYERQSNPDGPPLEVATAGTW